MRLQAILVSSALLLCGMRAAEADMRPLTIQNNGTKTIYKLFGWPSDLVPRTFNLLVTPIGPGGSTDIKVEDAYGSCVFAFQADFNNPRKPTRPTRVKQKFIALAYRDGVNLCGKNPPKVTFR